MGTSVKNTDDVCKWWPDLSKTRIPVDTPTCFMISSQKWRLISIYKFVLGLKYTMNKLLKKVVFTTIVTVTYLVFSTVLFAGLNIMWSMMHSNHNIDGDCNCLDTSGDIICFIASQLTILFITYMIFRRLNRGKKLS